MWTTPGGSRGRGYRGAMRWRVGAVAMLGVLALGGCGGGAPIPTLPPTPGALIFATEEEALAAAEEAYAAYSEVSDLISNEGGTEPERIAPFVTNEQLTREIETANYFASQGLRAVGRPRITKFDLQQFFEANGEAEVVVYVCLDVSDVAVVDASGADVTPPDRAPVVGLEVSLVGASADSLLIASSEAWAGSSFC